MPRLALNRKLVAAATVVAVAAGAGGAYAATQGSSSQPANPRQAFLNDAAGRLNVTPAQLRSALIAALDDQLAAAVRAGRLTQAQANAIERRIQQGGLPPFGGPLFGGGGGPGAAGGPPAPGPPGAPRGPAFGARGSLAGIISAAAGYLGLTPAQLISQVESGKSLAQIASARHKSAAGLEQAILSAVRSRLAQALAAGKITSAQEQRLLNQVSTRLNALVNRVLRFPRAARLPNPPRFGHPPPPPSAPGGP